MILEEYLTVAGENTLTTDWPTYMYAVIKPNNDDCSTCSKRMSGFRKFRQMYGGPECFFSLQCISRGPYKPPSRSN